MARRSGMSPLSGGPACLRGPDFNRLRRSSSSSDGPAVAAAAALSMRLVTGLPAVFAVVRALVAVLRALALFVFFFAVFFAVFLVVFLAFFAMTYLHTEGELGVLAKRCCRLLQRKEGGCNCARTANAARASASPRVAKVAERNAALRSVHHRDDHVKGKRL
jgi:hypothetical protein